MIKKKIIAVLYGYPFIILLCFFLLKCTVQTDLSGLYILQKGNCRSSYISLKKVEGFGKKYYIVTIYKDSHSAEKGTEYLGVINGNVITVKNGKIIVSGKSLRVISEDKNCIYIRTGDNN